MLSSYIYTSILPLPQGYCVNLQIPIGAISSRLTKVDECIIIYKYVYFLNGEKVSQKTFELFFKKNKYVKGQDLFYELCSQKSVRENQCGYVELLIKSKDGSDIFTSMEPFPQYEIFSNIGKKSFFSNFTNKTSDPQVIDQISLFKRFVTTFPVINLDLNKSSSTTLLFINPYKKAIVVSFKTHDLRAMDRKKILPHESVYYPLSFLLQQNKTSWRGQIQITANNRVVAVVVNHEKNNVENISNLEHWDPFRSDPTHHRLLQKIRNTIGRRLFKK